MDFPSLYSHGFARVAACSFPITLADPIGNVATVLAELREAERLGASVVVFPELALTGVTAADLLGQAPLLDVVAEAVDVLVAGSLGLGPVAVVGAPVRHGDHLLNCAVVVHDGHLLGVVPDIAPASRDRAVVSRWIAPGTAAGGTVRLGRHEAPIGADLLFGSRAVPGLVIAATVGGPSAAADAQVAQNTAAGASVVVSLGADRSIIGTADPRGIAHAAMSRRDASVVVHAGAGAGESSTDAVFDGRLCVYECGDALADESRFGGSLSTSDPVTPRRVVVDVDLDRVHHERRGRGLVPAPLAQVRVIDVDQRLPTGDIGLRRQVDRYPFVPTDPDRVAQESRRAFAIQVDALTQRIRAIGGSRIVLGVSGGLDSTHALLVAVAAMDQLGRPRSDILTYTMPGFATIERTRDNALRLSELLGVGIEQIDIRPAAERMLTDLGHPFAAGEPVHDVTFENVQAGLRTDYLFRLANHRRGIVLGTGDMSELALGWATYGVGDHMSHYGVNAGVPKTLIQHLVRWQAASGVHGPEVSGLLAEIVDQPISPELVPGATGVAFSQSTEAAIGPYALQDFTLHQVLTAGARPTRIAFLAHHAWRDRSTGSWPAGLPADARAEYDLATIRRWLEVFITRFFAGSQFKRSALPDGPQVVAGSLSPRGGWAMPSDSGAAAWLADLAAVPVG